MQAPIYAFEYAHDSAGGFVARIPGTNITSYAYPTSTAAVVAHNAPERVAIRMLDRELVALPSFVETCGYERMVTAAARHETAFAKPQR